MAEKANRNTNKKRKVKKERQNLSEEEKLKSNVFTEKHFNPNENFSYYLRDHKHKKGIVLT